MLFVTFYDIKRVMPWAFKKAPAAQEKVIQDATPQLAPSAAKGQNDSAKGKD